MTRRTWTEIGVAMVVLLGIILPRFFDLDAFLTADEKRWQARASGFAMHLAHQEWPETYYIHHPGITTQWFGALTSHYDSWVLRKLPFVVAQSVLLLFCWYLMSQLWGRKIGTIAALLLALNPLLIAHGRIYAMDALMTLFLIIWLIALLLWRETSAPQYLVFSALAASLAWLSKLPGVFAIPCTILLLMYWLGWHERHPKKLLRALLLWLITFVIMSCLVLPALAVRPYPILHDMFGVFGKEEYTDLHEASPTYYLQTLSFFATPLHWLGVLGILASFFGQRQMVRKGAPREQMFILIAFIVGFVAMMTLGSKKGDRYILPAFAAADLAAALAFGWWAQHPRWRTIAAFVLVVGMVWQAATLWRLHPHYLAYAHPLTKHWLQERRTGWGEGLDVAAQYLRNKPNAADLKVASYYPIEFATMFGGEVVPLHQHDDDSVDYVVLYRAMLQRGPEAWETDVWHHYRTKTPEKVIMLNGIPYAWIYSRPKS